MKRHHINKWKIVTIAGILIFVLGIAWIVTGFMEMNRYRKYTLSMAFDLGNPSVTLKVKTEEKNILLKETNAKALNYYMNTDSHTPCLGSPDTEGEGIRVECIRGDGNISTLDLYNTDREKVYLDYQSEQGRWKYYLGGDCTFEELQKIVSPEGKIEPNTVLKH